MGQMTWQWWLFQQSGRIVSGVVVWLICKLIRKIWKWWKKRKGL